MPALDRAVDAILPTCSQVEERNALIEFAVLVRKDQMFAVFFLNRRQLFALHSDLAVLAFHRDTFSYLLLMTIPIWLCYPTFPK